jgi:GH24 family phage-related lysozyme (muramidase)
MILLKTLLEQTIEPQVAKPKVLFIGDATLKKNYNFANKLIHSKRIKPNSKIKIKSSGTSEDLLNILEDNVKSHYNLFVFFVTHARTNNIMGMIENYQLAINTVHAHDSKIVVFTLPSIKFIRDTKKPISEREKSDRHELNTWIRLNSNADFIIDTELRLDDSMYFDSTGAEFNVEGHSFIYKQLLKVVNEINIDTDIDDTQTLDTKHRLSIDASSLEEIKQIHQLLLAAGYYIDTDELSNNTIGKTTKLAIRKYNNNINNQQSDDTDTQSDTGLTSVTQGIVSGNFSDDLVTQAYDLIIKYEGFNATAKWDVSNWRIGHGSSTVTMADGSVYRLSNNRSDKPTITITREDADRDLHRRVSDEFIPSVKKSLGADAYDAWEAGTIAALTSICYNYGSLPGSIIAAAKTKTTSTLVAAVRALETHNGGINKKRRNKEADYIVAAENYIPGVTDVKDFVSNTASTGWNKLTNILGSAVGSGVAAASVGATIFGTGASNLIGNTGGGDGGDWGGSLPKLISILPAGNWKASSQKRGKIETKSGNVSDHYMGNLDSYAADFFTSTAFGGDESKATAFAIAVAQNAGKNIDSWEPYVGKYLNIDSGDHRVQIIWQSMVGGNHYDHVHVGVTKL